MKGLYITFIIKRRKKIDKIMDYFLALAFGMVLFTFGFYMQFVKNQNDYNSSYMQKMAKTAQYEDINARVEASKIENATAIEISYNQAYKELEEMTISISRYATCIDDIYDVKIDGVTINSVEIVPVESKIVLGLYFDTATYGTDLAYRYRAEVYNLDWVPTNGIIAPDDSTTTSWEVFIDGNTNIEG